MTGEFIHEEVLRALVEQQHAVCECLVARTESDPDCGLVDSPGRQRRTLGAGFARDMRGCSPGPA